MMKRPVLLAALVASVGFGGALAAEIDPYAALGRATTPFLQIPNPGLDSYEADVELSGTALLDLLALARRRSLPHPEFVERMKADGTMHLTPSNPGYPADVVQEIEMQLLPFQLFFTTTQAENMQVLRDLRSRSQAEATDVELNGVPTLKVVVTPTGEALQAQGRELPNGDRRISRTVRTSYWIDKSNGTVLRIESASENRDETADGVSKGEAERHERWFEFEYENVAGRWVPVRAVQVIDRVDAFEERFSYRQEGEFVVLDHREVDYFQPTALGVRGTAKAVYRSYRFGALD
jgi:hypothetical protein